nr:peptidase C48, SUMO/sentrin/Ubl1 [Tanacetum cinerariifolium]
MEMHELFYEDEKFELFVKKFKEEFTTGLNRDKNKAETSGARHGNDNDDVDYDGHCQDEDDVGHANHGDVHANEEKEANEATKKKEEAEKLAAKKKEKAEKLATAKKKEAAEKLTKKVAEKPAKEAKEKAKKEAAEKKKTECRKLQQRRRNKLKCKQLQRQSVDVSEATTVPKTFECPKVQQKMFGKEQERRIRTDGKDLRMCYFPTDAVLLNEDNDQEKKYESFQNVIKNQRNASELKKKMKDVELAFFPTVVAAGQYYVIVFNLLKTNAVILDNEKHDDYNKYKEVFDSVQSRKRSKAEKKTEEKKYPGRWTRSDETKLLVEKHKRIKKRQADYQQTTKNEDKGKEEVVVVEQESEMNERLKKQKQAETEKKKNQEQRKREECPIGDIVITPKTVKDVLGLPMGRRNLEREGQREYNDPFLKEWKDQSKNINKLIIKALSDLIIDTKNTDYMLRMNILTLIANTLGSCENSSSLKFTVLKNVFEGDDEFYKMIEESIESILIDKSKKEEKINENLIKFQIDERLIQLRDKIKVIFKEPNIHEYHSSSSTESDDDDDDNSQVGDDNEKSYGTQTDSVEEDHVLSGHLTSVQGQHMKKMKILSEKKKKIRLKSKYVNKTVDPAVELTEDEKLLGRSIFSTQEKEEEEVFNDDERMILFRMNIQSLAPGLEIDTSVIDVYISILNYEENFKTTNMKRHLFYTSMMVPGILEDKTNKIDKKI